MSDYKSDEFKKRMRVSFDYNYAMKDYLESDDAVTPADIDANVEKCTEVLKEIKAQREAGKLPYMDLPYDTESLEEVRQLAGKVRYMCDDFVVLGLGGSALGATMLKHALTSPFFNIENIQERSAPKLIVADNIDPDWIASMISSVKGSRTIFNVISKSGSTAETMSQFLIAVRHLKDQHGSMYKDFVVATTDKNNGTLREMVNRDEFASLVVPDGVGGRFSVLSPVGLFPAAVIGVDIDQLLAGARYMDELCKSDDVRKNPAAISALMYYLYYKKGRNINVMMPYSSALKDIADWYRQLWAESLGKKLDLDGKVVNVGQTPVKALGITDQHSQLQLYVEGPDDKIITFIKVDEFENDVNIAAEYSDLEGVGYLGGNTLNKLIDSELRATEITLAKNKKPNCTITVPQVNPFTVGQLIYLLELQTSIMGGLLGINTYDQPGVEQGKQYTYGMMGKPGFEAKSDEIEGQKEKSDGYKI